MYPDNHCEKLVEEHIHHDEAESNVEDADAESDWRMAEFGAAPAKRDAALRDQQSTGRKRAARLYPLDRSAPCEWRGKDNCGGGTKPIKGCDEGMQLNRHHGPDKNTLNNEPGNVHRICAHCHNRWHAANDHNYVPGKPVVD